MKAATEDFLKVNTLRSTNTASLIPKRYDEHSVTFIGESPRVIRGTQQTVAVNTCSEGLLSPTIFGLKCAENCAYCFRRDKNVVWGTKTGQLAFSERQQQLVNSDNNISFPLQYSEV